MRKPTIQHIAGTAAMHARRAAEYAEELANGAPKTEAYITHCTQRLVQMSEALAKTLSNIPKQ